MLPLPIECPSCSHGNPAGSNYCNACGMPVGFLWCPRCDAVNRSNASHCHRCGETLAVAKGAEALAMPEGVATLAVANDVATPVVVSDATATPKAVEPAPSNAAARHRPVRLRVAMASVLLVALAVPAYLAQQAFTPAPPMAPVTAAAPAAEAVASPTIEPTSAAPVPSEEPPVSSSTPAPPRSTAQSSAKAKQRSGTRKPRPDTRNQSKAQSAARGTQ